MTGHRRCRFQGWFAPALALAAVAGCSSGTGGGCLQTSDCATPGDVCCDLVCTPVDSCMPCGATNDITANWHWEYICLDTLGSPCPVKTENTDVAITQSGGLINVILPPGGDDLAGTLCGDEAWWAETSASGTDNGCWKFDPAFTTFNQRSTADNGTRLCLGVGSKQGTPTPALPDCTALQNLLALGKNQFFQCPPAPPAAP